MSCGCYMLLSSLRNRYVICRYDICCVYQELCCRCESLVCSVQFMTGLCESEDVVETCQMGLPMNVFFGHPFAAQEMTSGSDREGDAPAACDTCVDRCNAPL